MKVIHRENPTANATPPKPASMKRVRKTPEAVEEKPEEPSEKEAEE